jgi:hypothetical protein
LKEVDDEAGLSVFLIIPFLLLPILDTFCHSPFRLWSLEETTKIEIKATRARKSTRKGRCERVDGPDRLSSAVDEC